MENENGKEVPENWNYFVSSNEFATAHYIPIGLRAYTSCLFPRSGSIHTRIYQN